MYFQDVVLFSLELDSAFYLGRTVLEARSPWMVHVS